MKEDDCYNSSINSFFNLKLNYGNKENPANALGKITNNFSNKQIDFVQSTLNNDFTVNLF